MNTHWTSTSTENFRYRITSDFLEQLRKKMKIGPIKQKELATRLNLTPGSISQTLNGELNNFELDTIIKYARALGMKVSLVAYEDSDPDNTRGPIDSEIFTICWEREGKPIDFFELNANHSESANNPLGISETHTSAPYQQAKVIYYPFERKSATDAGMRQLDSTDIEYRKASQR